MRKISTSLATLAALFFVGGVMAGESRIRGDDVPYLSHHLSTHANSASLRGEQLDRSNQTHDAGDCILSHEIKHHDDCSCEHDDWGCGSDGGIQQPHASIINVVGVESQLTATIIPAQVLVTNTTTLTNGTQCEESTGFRRRNDTEHFETFGNFSISKFDC